MTVVLRAARHRSLWEVGWLLAALGVAAFARAALNGRGALTAFITGAAFGVVLLALGMVSGWKPSLPGARSLLAGAVGGLVLIALPRLLHPLLPSVVGMRPEPFVAWVAVTGVVVAGEEVILRGVLFDSVEAAGGVLAAVLVTSLAFALIHVPLYGWPVVPLDLGVGLWFAGLRLASGGPGAPAVAHALADLSTWWI